MKLSSCFALVNVFVFFCLRVCLLWYVAFCYIFTYVVTFGLVWFGFVLFLVFLFFSSVSFCSFLLFFCPLSISLCWLRFLDNLPVALQQGLIQLSDLQAAVRRALLPRFYVGLLAPLSLTKKKKKKEKTKKQA